MLAILGVDPVTIVLDLRTLEPSKLVAVTTPVEVMSLEATVPTVIFGVPLKLAAVPDVFWLPAILTPGKLIGAVPLNDTPPIFLAVCSWVADEALPVTSPITAPRRVVAVKKPVIFALPWTSNS